MTTKPKLKKGESDKPLSERRSLKGSTAKRQGRDTPASLESSLPATKAGSESFARADLGPAGVARLEAMTPRQRFRDEMDEGTRAINVERATRGLRPLALFADRARVNGTEDEKLDDFINRLDDKADSRDDPFDYLGSGEVIDDRVSITVKRMFAVIPKVIRDVAEWEKLSIAVHEWQKTLLLPGQVAPVAPTPQQPGAPKTAEEIRKAALAKAEHHRPAVLISQKLRRGDGFGRVIV